MHLQPKKSREQIKEAFDNIVLPEEDFSDPFNPPESSSMTLDKNSSFSEGSPSYPENRGSLGGTSDGGNTDPGVSDGANSDGASIKKDSMSERFEKRMKSKRSAGGTASPASGTSSRENDPSVHRRSSSDEKSSLSSGSKRGSEGNAIENKIEEEVDDNIGNVGGDDKEIENVEDDTATADEYLAQPENNKDEKVIQESEPEPEDESEDVIESTEEQLDAEGATDTEFDVAAEEVETQNKEEEAAVSEAVVEDNNLEALIEQNDESKGI
jgi:hypothetical protein